MAFLIFDMDGVLLEPVGYHRALQETVRLAGIAIGYGEVQLTDEQITQFEALGISSEWHSSALCMAVMVLETQNGAAGDEENSQPVSLDFKDLFAALAVQPMQESALRRGVAAIEELAAQSGIPVELVNGLVAQSESIQHSPTLNWFQELILGSDNYTSIYQKEPQFRTESYLMQYDQLQLNEAHASNVLKWAERPGHGAAIMTNRPSRGPSGFSGMPDAEMGAQLVGLASLPLVGKGETLWLAAHTGRPAEYFAKPTWKHGLAAILVAGGWSVEESLKFVATQPAEWNTSALNFFQDSKVTVFEDTPGGLVAVQEAADLLNGLGLHVEVQKIGIAKEVAKRSTLSAQGAIVYSDINKALESLDNF